MVIINIKNLSKILECNKVYTIKKSFFVNGGRSCQEIRENEKLIMRNSKITILKE